MDLACLATHTFRPMIMELLFNFNSMFTAKLKEEIERCCVSFADSFDANIRALLQKKTHETPPPLPPPTPTTPTYNIATRNRFDLLSSE